MDSDQRLPAEMAEQYFLILGPLIEVNSSQSMIRLLMHANLQGMMHLIIPHLSKL